MSGEEGIKIQGKNIKVTCDKEVKLKGKNIKLEGSKGITSGGKQLAAEGDKVMGFDVHQMVVPSGSGTAVVPLPHPYLGKLVDKLSSDVKIKGHNVAVKGSKSKHDHPMHNQLPGTIRFNQDPNKEGEVTGGTASKLKINGKEAAVIGSTVTTCNDVGVRDNSVIVAVGASIPMPVIINSKNMGEYEEEREEREKKRPEFTEVKWSKSEVTEGEGGELTAQVKDIEDGNLVTFQVWKERDDPAVNIAYQQIPGSIEGGIAKGIWGYRLVDIGEYGMPSEDPKFFFTAHSAWCPYKRSGNMRVKLIRPEIRDLKWEKILYDAEGNETGTEETDEIEYGKTVALKVKVKNIPDGETISIKLIKKDETASFFYTTANIINGAAETKWHVQFAKEWLESLEENKELQIAFAAEYAKRHTQQSSGFVKIVFGFLLEYILDEQKKNPKESYTLQSEDQSYSQQLTIQDDIKQGDEYISLLFKNILIGKRYTLRHDDGENETVEWENIPFIKLLGV
jgi:uncharacterized Zn-binding protein involved in type VI secretion